jgi:hypothetical protein
MLAHLAAEIQPICWGQQATQLSGPYTALSSRRCSCIDPTARRFTSRRPASSCVHGGTNGTVRVACSNGPIIELPVVTMTSGASAARSAAFLRMRWRSPSDQRTSISRLRPSLHPSCCRISRNAATRTCPLRIVGGQGQKHVDAPHPVGLLGPRAKRPCECCASDISEKFASLHSTTS